MKYNQQPNYWTITIGFGPYPVRIPKSIVRTLIILVAWGTLPVFFYFAGCSSVHCPEMDKTASHESSPSSPTTYTRDDEYEDTSTINMALYEVGDFELNSQWVDFSDTEEWQLKKEKRVRIAGEDLSKKWGRLPGNEDAGKKDPNERIRDINNAHQYQEYGGPIDGLREWLVYKAMMLKKLDLALQAYKKGYFAEAYILNDELHTTGLGMSDWSEDAKVYYLQYAIENAALKYVSSCDTEWASKCIAESKDTALMFANCAGENKPVKYFKNFLIFKAEVDRVVPSVIQGPQELRWHSGYPDDWRRMNYTGYIRPANDVADCNKVLPHDASCRFNLYTYKHPEIIRDALAKEHYAKETENRSN